MKVHRDHERGASAPSSVGPASAPGKATLTQQLQQKRLATEPPAAAGPVQQRASTETEEAGGREAQVHEAAQQGIQGSGGSLPHLDRIQQAFGRHDVSGVSAHVGGAAAAASESMGAEAYAAGSHVAFRASPDLHTAAHEAAHVVQQRGGVQLKGGIGEAGDPYERHADAVADAVVSGGSAEGLLDQMAGGPARSGAAAIQRQEQTAPSPSPADGAAAAADPDLEVLAKGEQAIADGRTQYHWYPDASTDKPREFLFDDPDAEKLLGHLTNQWDGSPEARLEVPAANSGVPLWVSKFRQRALAVRTTPVDKKYKPLTKLPEASEKEIRQATVARKLCDAVAPKTAGEQFREDLVNQADKTVGKVIISTEDLKEIRHPTKPNKKGVIPKAMPGYTSCIDTAGNEIGSTKVAKGAKRPVLAGIGTLEVQNSPAFTRFVPGSSDRPRVGDFAIYAKDKGGQPAFQHINVIRRMDPPGPDGTETWYTVDGGQESTTADKEAPTAERTGKFAPATGAYGDRMLFGWVDVEKLYNDAQQGKKP
ncbi:MAG TPA: DUF4157 domain-containing protein [Kofleriaceae bacterium]|nr:DUF4157 domain-containing protein [Kofleriaceae bacterium]